MNRKIFFMAVLSIVLSAGAVKAQAFMTKEQLDQRRADMQAAREERRNELLEKKQGNAEQKGNVEKRCEMIQGKIQSRIENFDDRKDKHMAVYENMVARISKFIERLSGEGYDTTKVKADLEVLKGKIAKFSTDKDARLAALNDTKNQACGNSDGGFKEKLTAARAALKLVHEDAMDIRKYMLETVRPDIQALKKQKVETDKTDGTEKTETPEQE